MSEIENKYKAPALDKGLEILELLATYDRPMGMPEMARTLEKSKNQIYRMAHTLERRGYISRVPDTDTYQISNKLFALAMSTPPKRHLMSIALPIMQELALSSQQSCHLAVASEDHMIIIAVVESPSSLSFAAKQGHRQRLLLSASGRTIAAFNDDDSLNRWIKKTIAKGGNHDFDEAAFRKQIQAIRDRGHEESPSRKARGITDLSAPLFDGRSANAVAALSMPFVHYLDDHPTKDEVLRQLIQSAEKISDHIGVGY